MERVPIMQVVRYDEPGSVAQRERRRRILDATVALASDGGFDAVRMRLVAERAEVALGTLYRYFPSKIHLLVCALARELDRVQAALDREAALAPDRTRGGPADRVMHVLEHSTRSMQREPRLTEALIRAFMFADASAADEIRAVATRVDRMLTQAMRGPGGDSTADPAMGEQESAVAGVIGDVWLGSLVQWVTGRASAKDVNRSLDVAVRLLLR